MIGKFLKMICGVPQPAAKAKSAAMFQPERSEQPLYLPESELDSETISGVQPDGSCWQAWRVDASGKQWYRRISYSDQPATATPPIHAIAGDGDSDPLSPDDACEMFPKYRDDDGVLRINVELVKRNAAARILARDFARRESILGGDDDEQ